MGIIGINELIFPATLSNMTKAGNAVDGTISSWVSQGERATAFTRFSDDFNILQNIISEYKKLVLKDIGTINKIGAEIIKTDDVLMKFWR